MLYMVQAVPPAEGSEAKAGEVALGGSMTRQVSSMLEDVGVQGVADAVCDGWNCAAGADCVAVGACAQNEADAPHDATSPAAQAASHISNLGRLVEGEFGARYDAVYHCIRLLLIVKGLCAEDMEIKMRNLLQEVYFSSKSSLTLNPRAWSDACECSPPFPWQVD